MERRIIAAIQSFYPKGIPVDEIERALNLVRDLLGPTTATPTPRPPAPIPVRKPPPPATPGRKRGRPRKALPPAAPPRTSELIDFLNRHGPATSDQIQSSLGVDSSDVLPLLASTGAMPVGTIELEDGAILNTYALPEGH